MYHKSYPRDEEYRRQMNAMLEAMAQTLFKSWFVNFDSIRTKASGQPTGLSPHIDTLFHDSFEDSELRFHRTHLV